MTSVFDKMKTGSPSPTGGPDPGDSKATPGDQSHGNAFLTLEWMPIKN